MKSKTSCFNKTIFLKNITHFWPIWLIITGWNLFVLPFMIYTNSLVYATSNMTEKEMMWQRKREILSLVEVYTNTGILLVFSIVAAMAVFSYLYNSRAAYTMHAFPVTRKELFITNYVSGLLFLLVPEVIGFLTGTLVSAMCGYTSMDYLLKGLLFAMGISFFFYSFTVFIAMFTGQLFAVPIFTLIINFLYIGGKLLITGLTSVISYGISGTFTTGKLDILSPAYYIASKVYAKYDYSGEYAISKGLFGTEVVIGYALAAIIFVVAAYFIYKIRNTETAGSLISISWVAPIFRWGVAFFGGILFSLCFCSIIGFSSTGVVFFTVLVTAMIFGAISFFGAQMFLEKGFRVFKKKRVIECAGFLGVLVVLCLAIEFDVFGLEKKIPDVAEIERAYVNCGNIVGGAEDDSIAQVLEIHSQIIASKREFEAFRSGDLREANMSYVTVKYYLKGGKTLVRDYVIPAEKEMVEDSNTVIGKVADIMKAKETYLKNTIGVNYGEVEMKECFIDLYRGGNANARDFNSEDTKKLYEAVLKDAEEGNFEAIMMAGLINDENYDKNTYYDNLNFNCSGKTKLITMYNEYNSENFELNSEAAWMFESLPSGCYIQFDKNCTNIISALIETGVIQSEEDLTTYAEMQEVMEGDVVY